ncbi:hypothetical protein [Kitasatospora sp. NPDC093806]|uniref:hypothetical protein n=1 Tax=Kitasatospora sp. NPDC093806 TaxID=3155075 RepID=UPI0034135267
MNTPLAESQALDTLAARLVEHRAKLPSAAIPFELPEPQTTGRQLGELGHLIAETSADFQQRLSAEPPSECGIRAAWAYADVSDRLGQVVSARGAVTGQIAFFAHTHELRDKPDIAAARKTALRVLDLAVSNAQEELDEAVGRLRSESSMITRLAECARLEAAFSRTAPAAVPVARGTSATATAAVRPPGARKSR